MVSFGNASGPVPPVEPLLLSSKGSLFLTRPTLGHHVATREELLWRAGDVLSWIANGDLRLRVHKTYALSEAREAQEDLAGRKTTGKLLQTQEKLQQVDGEPLGTSTLLHHQ